MLGVPVVRRKGAESVAGTRCGIASGNACFRLKFDASKGSVFGFDQAGYLSLNARSLETLAQFKPKPGLTTNA